jgi:hypothetical protein
MGYNYVNKFNVTMLVLEAKLEGKNEQYEKLVLQGVNSVRV